VEYDATMAAARLVVVALLPSRRSAGQQTYLNAMLLGKPTIVSDTVGVREYIEDGVTGVIVPPGDASALREAILDVLDPANADRYETMGRRAREAVLARHTLVDYWDHELLDAAGI
jgi:glycosyltransferase involved in cell wall biosynthesis